MRGVVVEWLDRLDYGAESRRKVVRGWDSPCDDWKTASVHPAVNGNLSQSREGYGSERKGMGLHLSSAVPKIQWGFNPTAIRLWEIVTISVVRDLNSQEKRNTVELQMLK